MNEEFTISSYIKGIPLAKGGLLIKIKENKYSLRVNAKSVGVFSVLLGWTQTIRSLGIIKKNKFTSVRYQSSDIRGNKKGHMEIDFSNIAPEIISAQPDPREDKRRNINRSFLLEVNDPATAIFNLAFNKCKNQVKVYDGKRRYNIEAISMEEAILKHSLLSENSHKTYKCNYQIKRIAGYTKKELEKFPKKGIIWIKKHSEFNFYYPLKIKIETKWGNFLCFIKERSI